MKKQSIILAVMVVSVSAIILAIIGGIFLVDDETCDKPSAIILTEYVLFHRGEYFSDSGTTLLFFNGSIKGYVWGCSSKLDSELTITYKDVNVPYTSNNEGFVVKPYNYTYEVTEKITPIVIVAGTGLDRITREIYPMINGTEVYGPLISYYISEPFICDINIHNNSVAGVSLTFHLEDLSGASMSLPESVSSKVYLSGSSSVRLAGEVSESGVVTISDIIPISPDREYISVSVLIYEDGYLVAYGITYLTLV